MATASRALSMGAVVGFAGQIVTIGGGLIGQVIVARHLTPADFGAYAVATTLTYLFAVVLRAGLHSLAVRVIAQTVVTEGDGRGLTRRIGILSSAVAITATPVLGLLVLPLSNHIFLNGRLNSAEIWILTVTISAEAMRFVYSECFRGFNRQGSAAILGNAGRTLLFVALVVAVVLLDDTSTLIGVLVVALVASVLAAIAAGLSLTIWVTSSVSSSQGAKPQTRNRNLLRGGAPFMLTELCSFALAMGDVLVVSLFSNEASTALYATASRAASMLMIPTYVLVGLLSPLIAALWTQRRLGELQSILARSVMLTSILTLAGLVVTALGGGWILSVLFGDPFAQAAPILSILALGATANVIFGQGFQVLMLCGRARIATLVNASFAVATVVAELVCGSLFGIYGVAIASAAGLTLQQATLSLVTRRLLGLRAYPYLTSTTRDLEGAVADRSLW